MTFEIWHNPRCSKSRATLTLLQEAGVEVRVRRYLDDPPTAAELHDAIARLGITPVELVRRKEERAKALGLDRGEHDAETVVRALADHPILIERPVVLSAAGAVIGRPPERVEELLAASRST